jgi:hypothetical protein|nr:MAG TPA: hypothetical protein [Caudoviricetes sp.]
MNFTNINLDLQAVAKRTYENIYYQSTFMNFLDDSWMQVARATGTPIIEVVKQIAPTINKRSNVEITTALTPALTTYNSVKVDLTELPLDYSFSISPLMIGTNIEGTLEGQMRLKDSAIANQIDTYGYGKLNTAITGKTDGSEAYTEGQVVVWAPSTQQDYINYLNQYKMILFNRNVTTGYMLGLEAVNYGNLVAALTSILKYETRAGVEGVDRGVVANAYGVDIFPINTAVIGSGVLGYFANKIACVGDMFFSSMAQYNGNYPGLPGYFVLEGNIMFGAEVVRPEAILKLAAAAVE